MKKTTLIITLLLITISVYCQTKENKSKLNFDFEKSENGVFDNWSDSGSADYVISVDSTIFKEGKYAASIEFKGEKKGYKALEFKIPNNYNGNKITLTGYIKTENVTEGYAGLWMSIDPGVAFENMSEKGITGTTDWEKYSITLNMDALKTDKIVFGGILEGKGKMWLDDLTITIDGTNIEDLTPFIIPAKADKEFDNGSKISVINLENTDIENLKTLGLVWGFLKYHHPNIAKGDFNWDYELFRVLPKVLNAKNNKEIDVILVEWINSLGVFQENKEEVIITDEIKMKPDLDWISNSNFSNELTALLLSIQNAERTGDNYYVSIYFDGTGPPAFLNENPYPTMEFPDTGFRILALYRYWNIIQYFFPYKYLIGEDWKNVLSEFIPKIISAKNETEYMLTVLELIASINDTHGYIWGDNKALSNYKEVNYPPVKLSFIEDKAVVSYFNDDVLAEETGLKIGDVISKINNKSVDIIVKEKLKYIPASNYATKLRIIALRTLVATNDSILNIEYIRDQKKENTVIKVAASNESKIWKKEYDHLADTCFKLITPKIAYLSQSSVKGEYMSKIWNDIKNTKGLILDCRYPVLNAPSDSVSKYLYPKKAEFAKLTVGNTKTPGLFTFGYISKTGEENIDYYKGKVIILVNEDTQSTSEFHAMAYQKAPNAIVIGSQTAAADGNVSDYIYFPGKITTMISGMGVYYPDGTETQRIGIKIDVEVKPTIEGIKDGRDEVVEKAIELINQ